MSDAKKVRNKWLTIRMTEAEYEELERLKRKTTHQMLSGYCRDVLFRRPVYVRFRSKSLDEFLDEIIALRKDFKAVAVNFNQVVHKLHTLQEIPEFRIWLLINEKHKDLLFAQIKAIQDRVNEVYAKWYNSQKEDGLQAEKGI